MFLNFIFMEIFHILCHPRGAPESRGTISLALDGKQAE